MSTNTIMKEKTKIKIKEPKMYNVIMYNDDFTSMEFVVYILETIFNKGEEEAVSIMMTVHKSGKAIVGKYSYDVAMTKTTMAMELAKEEGFPFKIKVEEE